MRRWKKRPPGSNWGEYGDDDQIGRMNLLTPEARLRGFAEVREGRVFSLSLPLDYPGGTAVNAHRQPPKLQPGMLAEGGLNYHRCLSCYEPLFYDVTNDDAVTIHTQYSTQWDALSHFGQQFDADDDGGAEIVFYNGYGTRDVRHPDEGGPYSEALGIDALSMAGVQGRAVLANLFEVYGSQRLRVGYDALMRVLDAGGTEVGEGDFLCIYTGYADAVLAQAKNPDGRMLRSSFVGLDGADEKLLKWIDDSRIVALCADNPAVEYVSVKPRQQDKHSMLPLHELCLFKIGVHLGELWWLGELANWLRDNNRSAFLLTAPPLRLPGSVGSPVTPIATV